WSVTGVQTCALPISPRRRCGRRSRRSCGGGSRDSRQGGARRRGTRGPRWPCRARCPCGHTPPCPSSSARATRSTAAALRSASLAQDRLTVAADLVLRHLRQARSGDDPHPGVDAALEVGTPRAEFLAGATHEGLDAHPHRLVLRHLAPVALLEGVARVLAPGTLREVLRLLVATARDVVLEEPAYSRPLVEAGED